MTRNGTDGRTRSAARRIRVTRSVVRGNRGAPIASLFERVVEGAYAGKPAAATRYTRCGGKPEWWKARPFQARLPTAVNARPGVITRPPGWPARGRRRVCGESAFEGFDSPLFPTLLPIWDAPSPVPLLPLPLTLPAHSDHPSP